jgi:hypothetical protein
MIRIKKFNESQKFPTQVNSQEFMKKKSTHKMVDFSYSEEKQVKEILRSKGKDFSFSNEFFEVFMRPKSIEVVKLNDEWYTIIEGSHGPYYICDGFEEVIGYIKQL